jgi:hypothetical protein
MMDAGQPARRYEHDPAARDDAVARRLDSSDCAVEVLAIVAYLTSADGPLQDSPTAAQGVSPWHSRLLLKASERLTVVDAYMRGQVAFLVAGRDHGYHAPETELELAGAVLDTCRATMSVVDALVAGRLPTRREFETMSVAALAVNPALDAARRAEADPDAH